MRTASWNVYLPIRRWRVVPNYEAVLEVRHDCPYCNITERHTGIHITAWDTTAMHIAVVSCDREEELADFQQELSASLGYEIVSRQANRLEVVIRDRDVKPDSVTSLISRCDCWCTQPSIAENGWERYRVFSWDKANLSRLVGLITAAGGTVRVGSVKQLGLPSFSRDMMVPVSNILHGLTQRQIDALMTALERGYYDSPSQISAGELARALKLSRSTLSEHLRKAEARLLLNILPLMRMAHEEED